MMNKALNRLSKTLQDKLKKQKQPSAIDPMLATLTKDYFSDPDWIYERKLDGERCLIYKKNGVVTLQSRNQKKQNSFYPEIVEAFKHWPGDFILDSELVTFDGKVTSFSKLQNRMHVNHPSKKLIKQYPVYAYVFDIIYLDGYLLDQLPLRKRKGILKQAFDFSSPIRYLPHRNKTGEAYYQEACRKNWEGVIAKQAQSQYIYQRSKKWLKFKCGHGQEFVVGGYTKPHGERIGFGALLLGYYQSDQLKYCGRVGTGFDDEFLEFLHHKLVKIKQSSSPFAQFDESNDEITWVEPTLVAEVGFTEWTQHNKLRHPRFLGLRKDKAAEEVHREDKG